MSTCPGCAVNSGIRDYIFAKAGIPQDLFRSN